MYYIPQTLLSSLEEGLGTRLHHSKLFGRNTGWESLTCCELPNVRRLKVMSRTSTRYKTCIKISSNLFNFLFCIQEVVRISCNINMAIKIQQVILPMLFKLAFTLYVWWAWMTTCKSECKFLCPCTKLVWCCLP